VITFRFRHIFLTLLATVLVAQAFAQDTTYTPAPQRQTRQQQKRNRMNNALRMEEEGDLIFNRQNIFGIHLASDGYGISFEKGFFRTPTRTLLWEFELNEKHSPKEHHISATTDGFDFSSVVPYKLNNLYEFKMSIGQQILIGGKGNKNGVAVTALYAGGITIGMLKPYYLDITNAISGASNQQTYAQFASDSTTGDQITGAAGFLIGWDNLTIKPGLNAKQGMRFDYGRLNQTVAAIEVGLTEEFFSGKMPIMYSPSGSINSSPPKQFFFNAYVAILFGNRK
jgi:hypothetical protein